MDSGFGFTVLLLARFSFVRGFAVVGFDLIVGFMLNRVL